MSSKAYSDTCAERLSQPIEGPSGEGLVNTLRRSGFSLNAGWGLPIIRAAFPQALKVPLPHRIVLSQLLLCAIVAAGLLVWDGSQAVAALLAGVSCVVPGALYAWRVTVERSPAKLLSQGAIKFALTLALMAVCIIAFKPAAAGFFGTFALLQLMYVVGPIVFDR